MRVKTWFRSVFVETSICSFIRSYSMYYSCMILIVGWGLWQHMEENCGQNIGCCCCCCSHLSHRWFHFWTFTVTITDVAAISAVFNYTLTEMCESHSLEYVCLHFNVNAISLLGSKGKKTVEKTAIMRDWREKTHVCSARRNRGAISVKDCNEKSSLNRNEIRN